MSAYQRMVTPTKASAFTPPAVRPGLHSHTSPHAHAHARTPSHSLAHSHSFPPFRPHHSPVPAHATAAAAGGAMGGGMGGAWDGRGGGHAGGHVVAGGSPEGSNNMRMHPPAALRYALAELGGCEVAPPAPPHGGPLPLPRAHHTRPALPLGALAPLLVGGAAHVHAHGGAGVGRSARVHREQ
ncbi:unnamed protein product [Closterium sp. Naga37s-1]|nr:unnamed protein product [Closterium sp. Naga37s-1]